MTPAPRKWYKHPFFTLTGWLFGLVGVVYIFVDREVKAISYDFPEPQKIYDSRFPASVRVLDQSGQIITDDVYVREVVVWNSGTIKVDPADVRIPLTIRDERPQSSVSSRILDFKVVAQADPNITEARVRSIRGKDGQGLELTWQHLDAGHAVRLQFIYSTNGPTEFGITGTVEGIAGLTNVRLPAAERYAPWFPRNLSFAIMGVFTWFFGNGLLAILRPLITEQKKGVIKLPLGLAGLALFLIGFSTLTNMFTYLFFTTPSVVPPI